MDVRIDDGLHIPALDGFALAATLYEPAADHRHVTPQEVGAPAIGHFGFFRERFRATLWRESASWLSAQAAAV